MDRSFDGEQVDFTPTPSARLRVRKDFLKNSKKKLRAKSKTKKKQPSTLDAFMASVGSAETSIAQTVPETRGTVEDRTAMELSADASAF